MSNHEAPCGHPQEVVSSEYGCQLCDQENAAAYRTALLEANVQRRLLREVRGAGCECSDVDGCRFARERDENFASYERVKALYSTCVKERDEARAALETTQVRAAAAEDALHGVAVAAADYKDRAEKAEADAAAMRGVLSKVYRYAFDALYSYRAEIIAALSTDAGRALSERVQRLEAFWKAYNADREGHDSSAFGALSAARVALEEK